MLCHSNISFLICHYDIDGVAHVIFYTVDDFRFVVFRNSVIHPSVNVAYRVGSFTVEGEIIYLLSVFFSRFDSPGMCVVGMNLFTLFSFCSFPLQNLSIPDYVSDEIEINRLFHHNLSTCLSLGLLNQLARSVTSAILYCNLPMYTQYTPIRIKWK